MDPVNVVVVGGLAVTVAVGVWEAARVALRDIRVKSWTWARAADQLGVRSTPATLFSQPSIAGEVGDLTVSVSVDRQQPVTVYRITGLPQGITLAPGSAAVDFRTGDPAFDGAVTVEGIERTAVSLLFDPKLRALVLHTIRDQNAVLSGGVLTSVTAGTTPQMEVIVRRVREMLELAKAFDKRLRVPEEIRLTKAMQSADGEVAHRALELLVESRLPEASTIPVCEELLLRSTSPVTRFLAACHAGEAGIAHLAGLVADQRNTSADLRAAALERLAPRLPAEKVGALLEEGMRDIMRPVRLAAIRAVRALRRMESAARLATLAEHRGVNADEQLAIAEAFADLGGEHAEGALLALLRAERTDIRMVAVSGLALHGTAAAVPALRAVEDASGLLDSAMKTAVRDAIAAIQARVPESAAGGLALAAPQDQAAGAVSLADARGALSTVAAKPEKT